MASSGPVFPAMSRTLTPAAASITGAAKGGRGGAGGLAADPRARQRIGAALEQLAGGLDHRGAELALDEDVALRGQRGELGRHLERAVEHRVLLHELVQQPTLER